jgi:hypothetical protein
MQKIYFFAGVFPLIILLLPFMAVGEEYTPLYGVHTDFGLVWEYGRSIPEFVADCAEKGYSAIMFIPMDKDGYYFISPTLENLGWNYATWDGKDALTVLVEETRKHNLKLFIDLQGLAYKALNPEDPKVAKGKAPTADDVADVVSELADYGVDGIAEEMFLADWYEPVYRVCRERGILYIHKAINWDFGAMSHTWKRTVFQVYPNCDVIMTEDYDMRAEPPQIAALEQFPSIAKGLGKEYWMKVCPDDWALRSVSNMENVILLKAIQFKPKYIFVMVYDKKRFDEFDLSEMTDLIKEYASDEEKKPLCNLVLHLTGDVDPDTWNWWWFPIQIAAISTGIKASGYDILTTDEPIDNADMYYIYTRGKWRWGETLDLPDNILKLFDSGKPVFLQLSQTLPESTPNWRSVRTKLGIDNTLFEDVLTGDALPKFGIFKGIQYLHFGTGGTESRMNPITPENIVDGEILSTGEANGKTYVLMVRKENNYFINGSYLHIQASFPISNVINDGLQRPGNFAVTAGDLSAVFYALDVPDDQLSEIPLHIKLPNPLTDQIRWFKRDFNGVTSSGVTSYDPEVGYVDTLTEGSILVLKTRITSPVMGDVTGNGKVTAYDAAFILRWLVGLIDRFPCSPDIIKPDFPDHADVSGNGSLSAFDAALILQHVVGLRGNFPEGEGSAPALTDPDITIPDIPLQPSRRITVPINLTVADGISAGEFTLSFNPAVLKPIDVSTTALTSGYLLERNIRDGRLEISFAGADILKGSGALVNMEFEVLEGRRTTLDRVLTLRRARLNEKMIIDRPANAVMAKPARTTLLQNFPNPFNPETWIPYQLAKHGEVVVSIFDVQGRLIRRLRVGYRPAGYYVSRDRAVYWDGRNERGEKVSSGVYVVELRAGDFTATRRMMLVK